MENHRKIIKEMLLPSLAEKDKLLESESFEIEDSFLRYKIAIALLFSPSDERHEKLTRELFAQEITHSIKKDGDNDCLDILGYLLTGYNRFSDRPLFDKAMVLGFEPEYLHDGVFSRSADTMPLADAIDLAFSLQQRDYASELIDLWIQSQRIWDEENLLNLRYYERDRKNDEGELEALRKFALLAESKPDWEFCSAHRNLCEKQYELALYDQAAETILKIYPRIICIKNWLSSGLGVFITETALDIISQKGICQVSQELWELFGLKAKESANPVITEKVKTAAKVLGL